METGRALIGVTHPLQACGDAPRWAMQTAKHVLVKNAVVLGHQMRAAESILSSDAGEFDHVLRINTLGAALGLKDAALGMAPCKTGSKEHSLRHQRGALGV